MTTAVRDITPPVTSGSDDLRQHMLELARNTKPRQFNIAGQLLSRGRTDTPLAATEDLSIRLKIYAEGGENALHAHPGEDHAFIVLQGKARFHGPADEETVLGADQGIMLPAGNLYRFEAVEGEPLVMLRIGSPNYRKQPDPNRIDSEGNPMRGDSRANKTTEVEYLEGRYYGCVGEGEAGDES